ncbi:hypothetical protein ICHIJ1_14680 [Fluviibacter phosphoraccumulans]|nr:hypothetical protein ICHIJ1_14680 [Fluviibacter phosphoraccumulans]
MGPIRGKVQCAYAYRDAALAAIATGAIRKLTAAPKALLNKRAVNRVIDVLWWNGHL